MITLIVLAAGKSTRMRGPNKLLTRIDGKPMIRKIVETALNSKVDEVIVVLGWEASKVREVLADLPCRLILNKNFEEGQSTSLKAGLSEASEAARAILVLPGDIAKIDTQAINLVVDAYNQENAAIVVAAHEGKPGHPILLSRKLFREIAEIEEQTFGLKSIIKNHENEIRLVETGSTNILMDVDTPEDLRDLLERT